VRVVVSRDSSSAALQRHLLDALPDSKVHIVDGVHSKYLLVNADYLGRRQRLVWTGSHNYTGPALRGNDEALLKIDDRAVYDAFRANWQRAWDTLR
jgi:phosphatidylserine/phosphatidylglycerophosphate/cardiolipin synthase-like enzyme